MLAAVTAPGDSGAPVVDADGQVVGVLFAFDLSRDTTAYALTGTELDAVLEPGARRHRAAVATAPATASPSDGPDATRIDPGAGPGRSRDGASGRATVSRPR